MLASSQLHLARGVWCAFLVATACGGGNPRAVAPVVVREQQSAAVAPVAAAVSVPKPKALCEALLEISQAAQRTFPVQDASVPNAKCVKAKHGAFAMVVSFEEDASSQYGPGYQGLVELIYADEDGRILRSRALSIEESGTVANRYEVHGVADYDGDGTDELLLDESDWAFEGTGDYHSEIWRVANGRLEPYPAVDKIAIARFADLDGDALPDLEVATPFQGTIDGCGPDGSYIEFGPKWVLHAQKDGTFAFDAASRAEVQRACPDAPKTLVARAKKNVDNSALRERLACAVAWGVPPDTIVQELNRDCPKLAEAIPDCPGEFEERACINQPQLAKWAAVKPPFFLR